MQACILYTYHGLKLHMRIAPAWFSSTFLFQRSRRMIKTKICTQGPHEPWIQQLESCMHAYHAY